MRRKIVDYWRADVKGNLKQLSIVALERLGEHKVSEGKSERARQAVACIKDVLAFHHSRRSDMALTAEQRSRNGMK